MDDVEHSNTLAEDAAETSFKKRPRKKHLYNQILQQMEFYFSDANLTRDRFLSQLLAGNKNVPLEVFLRFNKIRALTGNTEEIAKALRSSQLLKISEDGKSVYRTSAIQKKENQDDCIIYVEQLPPDANHDWVIGIFSAYGKVEYVSIPKYKNRAVIKGFAFVEFDTPEAAKKALEAFGSAGCCLPPQMPPEELCSIATFEVDDSEETSENKDNIETPVSDKQTKKHKKKNKLSSEEAEVNLEHEREPAESEEPKPKKIKTEVDEQYVEEKSKKKKKKVTIDAEDNQQEPLEDNVSESETTESHRTKKVKKRKLDSENPENLMESKYYSQEASSSNAPIKKKKKKFLVDEEVREDEREDSQIEDTAVNETPATMKKKKKHQQVDDTEITKHYTEVMEDDFNVSNNLQQTRKRKKKQHEAENEDDADKEIEDAEDEGTSKRSKKQTDGEDVGETGDDDDDDDNDETGAASEKSDKKKRARKRNKNQKKKKIVDKKENDPTSLGLRIISKNEWRRLRNKYLNLQREKMQALKKHLARAKFGSSYQSPYPAKENGRRAVKEEPKSKETKFMPGVIIHIDLAESLGDVKAFKTNARSHPGVTYIDASEGDSEVYIRCSSSEVAQKLVDEQPWDNMQILAGKAEKKYWEKIMEDREHKIKNKVRVNVRGREKLLKRAERELGKHIKFDD